tara:strand:+ start:23 stop:316 length:294 start_codon:yes stop_codon:yes gene_type:complete
VKLNASPAVDCVAEGNVTDGTPLVVDPKPPTVAAEFESTVVTLLPEILYEEPILSAVLAAESDSNFTLEDILCVMSASTGEPEIKNKNGRSFLIMCC